MENHHFQWVNPLYKSPFSIAMLNYQRVFESWMILVHIDLILDVHGYSWEMLESSWQVLWQVAMMSNY